MLLILGSTRWASSNYTHTVHSSSFVFPLLEETSESIVTAGNYLDYSALSPASPAASSPFLRKTSFACPFFKHGFVTCETSGFNNIHHLKYANQNFPAYLCSTLFSFIKDLIVDVVFHRDHITERTHRHRVAEPTRRHTITEAQRKAIKKRKLRNGDDEVEWYRIYDTLFPGKKRFESIRKLR